MAATQDEGERILLLVNITADERAQLKSLAALAKQSLADYVADALREKLEGKESR